MRLGFIINPVAGLGGSVGLKGSDGIEIQREALARGAVPQAQARAMAALGTLRGGLRGTPGLEILTCPGEMGADAVMLAGFSPALIERKCSGPTSAEDTLCAARAMRTAGVDLLLFAGGDGTARDILNAVGADLPVLGIPAGVKIHSGVFATHPRSAGELAARYLQGSSSRTQEAEVVDQDEDAYREGRVSACLYGYLRIPYEAHLVQGRKSPSPLSDSAAMVAIAQDVIGRMQAGRLYILGPGTTTRAIAARLGIEKTLVGVDVVVCEQPLPARLLHRDSAEADLLSLVSSHPADLIITPVGGQGFLFGRGNQQISPAVIRAVGRDHILIASTPGKLTALAGRPLLVDTGDPATDRLLSGYARIITGYHEESIYRVD